MNAVERETVIVFNESEDTATISTYNKSLSKKLKDIAPVYSVKDFDGEAEAFATVPKKWVKISKPRTVVLTEEHKQKLREGSERWRNARLDTENIT